MVKTTLKTTLLALLIPCTLMACQSTTAIETKQNTTTSKSTKYAPQKIVTIYAVSAEGIQDHIGQIILSDSPKGLRIHTELEALSPGFHGFHIHQFGSCTPAEKDGKMVAALSAGGHFNPTHVAHGTPNEGHLGDLPVLNVDHQGRAKTTIHAARLNLDQVQGLSIIINEGGDNYSDHPYALGGGGGRIACGVID